MKDGEASVAFGYNPALYNVRHQSVSNIALCSYHLMNTEYNMVLLDTCNDEDDATWNSAMDTLLGDKYLLKQYYTVKDWNTSESMMIETCLGYCVHIYVVDQKMTLWREFRNHNVHSLVYVVGFHKMTLWRQFCNHNVILSCTGQPVECAGEQRRGFHLLLVCGATHHVPGTRGWPRSPTRRHRRVTHQKIKSWGGKLSLHCSWRRVWR